MKGEASMQPIIGRLRLELRDATGELVDVRRARNSVMQAGARLIADLFRGAATTPINGMAVGVSPEPPAPPYNTTALTTTNPDATPALSRFTTPVPPTAMTVEVLEPLFKVRVSVRGLIPAGSAVSPDAAVDTVTIGEAALGVLSADGLSLATLYNRVVFEPIRKARTQEIALYWDVDFPFGA
jgi:hypothetical protein